ncbi:MAG: hypothetical protein FD129_3251 [bacterium]|nr:MAG: hypothetical protein FD129_3251 [bacterium]
MRHRAEGADPGDVDDDAALVDGLDRPLERRSILERGIDEGVIDRGSLTLAQCQRDPVGDLGHDGLQGVPFLDGKSAVFAAEFRRLQGSFTAAAKVDERGHLADSDDGSRDPFARGDLARGFDAAGREFGVGGSFLGFGSVVVEHHVNVSITIRPVIRPGVCDRESAGLAGIGFG